MSTAAATDTHVESQLRRYRDKHRKGSLPAPVDRWLTDLHGTRWMAVRDAPTLETAWFAMAEAVRDFHAVHGRWPSQIGDGDEKRLGQWLNTQRKVARRGALRSDRVEWMDTNTPGWNPDTTSDIEDMWCRYGLSVASFRENHGRWPSPSGQTDREKFLGKWLANQRFVFNKGIMRPERKAWLDANLAGWITRR